MKLAYQGVAFAFSLLATTAIAAPAPDDVRTVDGQPAHPAHPPAGTRGQAKHAANAGVPEQISVLAGRHDSGGGLMQAQTASKSISTVNHEFIARQSPITAPETLIADLPGVQTSNEGPISTTSQTVHIRGLDQTQIGFLFEDIPIADPYTYAPTLSGQLDDENIGKITVTQGSSDINAPLYNADGAEVDMTMRRPVRKYEVFADTTFGTRSTQKQFVRIDTGEIGNSGVRAYLSGSYSSGNLWRGPGSAYRWHSDLNIDKSWGQGNDVDFIFNYNHSNQTEWLYPTLAQWKQYGSSYNTNADYYSGNTAYYKLNTKAVNNLSSVLHTHFELGNGFSLEAIPYTFHNAGPNNYGVTVPLSNGYLGTSQYAHLDGMAARPGTLTAISVHPFVHTSSGITTTAAWRQRNNTLKLSYWYSYVVHTEHQDDYPLDNDGSYTKNNGHITVLGGRNLTQYAISGVQQVNSISLDDTFTLLGDRLSIEPGLKNTMISRQFSEDLPGANPGNSIKNIFEPSPQLLLSYRLNTEDQIYASGTTGFRAPSSFQSQVATYSFTSPLVSSSPLQSYHPEYMIGEEIGFRHSGAIMATIAAFNYNLTHHQINSTAYLANSTILVGQPIDAGGETARGVQIELGTRPWHNISTYASGQYLHSEINNNIAYGGDYLPTKGKDQIASPKFLAALGLTYDDGFNTANFNLRYQDSQYSTLMNDQSMPSYVTADMSIGHRFRAIAGHVRPKVSLEMLNLADSHYLSTVNGFTVAANPTRGVFGHTIAGSSPTYAIGTGFTALVTLSAQFD